MDNKTPLGKKISGIFNNKRDKIITFEIRFIDTIAFMASSLDELATNLKNGCNNVQELRNVFSNTSEYFTDDKEFLMMTQKGVYPYDYINILLKIVLNILSWTFHLS
jgi:hypothetical protein